MLDKLRKGAGGWVAQLFIALLVVSFAVWGVSDIFRGFRGDTVASVGNTDISIQSFGRQYDLAMRQLGQQLGQPVSAEQSRMFGLPQQVLGRLATEATLNDEAASLGLGVSSETLAQQIKDDPRFKGSSGEFDRNLFSQIIGQQGLSEDQYIEELRRNYVRQQIVSALVGATAVPEAYLKALHEYRAEERNIGYLVLAATLVGDVGQPTDADLNTYFEANKAEWRAPELRAVKLMRMAPEDLADTGGISDDEAKKAYDAQLATRYTTAEKRKLEQVVFKTRAEAEQTSAAVASGKTFDALLAERNLKPADVDLGLVTRDKLADPKVADAAFSLAPNSVSGVVDGAFGPMILRVTTIEPHAVKTFDEVKADIKQELANQRAALELADQLDVIEDARAGGETLDDIAAKYDLKVVTIPAIDKTGKDADGNPVADLPAGTELVSGVFASDVGIENDPVGIPTGGYVWYEVTAVTAERDRELAEVRDKVVADWKTNEVTERLTAKAADIRDRLAKGEDIAKIAGELGAGAKTAEKLTRTTAPTGDLSATAIQAAFGGPNGHAAVAAGSADQSQIVLVVTGVVVPPFFSGSPELAQGKEQLSTQIANDLLQQYVGQLQTSLGVQINQAALAQIIGAPDS